MTNDALLAEARSVVCLVEPGDKKAMLTEHAEIATSDRGVTENRDHFFCCVDTARTTGSKLCVSNRRVATRANFHDADIIEVAGAGDRTMPRAWNNDQPLQVGGRAQKEVHKCTEFIRSKTYLIQQSLRHGDVVVCCWNGRSRSPTVVAAWLIEYRGLSLACAKAFMEDAFQIQRPRLSKTAGSSVPNLSKFDLSLAELIPAMHLQDNVTEHDVTEQQGNEIDTDDEVPASDVGSPSSDQSGATQMYTPNSVALNGASHEMMYGPSSAAPTVSRERDSGRTDANSDDIEVQVQGVPALDDNEPEGSSASESPVAAVAPVAPAPSTAPSAQRRVRKSTITTVEQNVDVCDWIPGNVRTPPPLGAHRGQFDYIPHDAQVSQSTRDGVDPGSKNIADAMKLINDVTAQCIRDWNTRSVGENEQVVRALLDGMTTILQQFKHDDDLNGMTVNSETRFETRSNYHFTLLQGILAKSVIDERETCELIAWMCHRGAGSAQPLHKYIGRHKPNETVAWTRALLARLFAGTSTPTQCDGGVEVWIRSVTYGLQRTLFEFPHLPPMYGVPDSQIKSEDDDQADMWVDLWAMGLLSTSDIDNVIARWTAIRAGKTKTVHSFLSNRKDIVEQGKRAINKVKTFPTCVDAGAAAGLCKDTTGATLPVYGPGSVLSAAMILAGYKKVFVDENEYLKPPPLKLIVGGWCSENELKGQIQSEAACRCSRRRSSTATTQGSRGVQ
jgi:hypothetical protein